MFNRFNNLGKKIRTEEDLNDTKKVRKYKIIQIFVG